MSYLSKNLSVLAYANGFTLWHYTTPDAPAGVRESGYFNAAADMLRVGDILVCNLETSGNASGDLLMVTANAGGTVSTTSLVNKE